MTKMIKDDNLKFAILGSLCAQGVLKFMDKEKFVKEQSGEEYDDTADYNYAPYEPARAYWLQEFKQVDLSKLKELVWDASADIQYDIWTYYDGEDEYFDIMSLRGIDQLQNLQKIHIEFFGQITDLKELLKLKKLSHASFTESLALNSANKKAFKKLTDRGVVIQIDGRAQWPESPETVKQPVSTPESEPETVVPIEPAPISSAPALEPEPEPLPERFDTVEAELKVLPHYIDDWRAYLEAEMEEWMNLLSPSTTKLIAGKETEDRREQRGGAVDGGIIISTLQEFTGENRGSSYGETRAFWNENEPSNFSFEFKLRVSFTSLAERHMKVNGYAQAVPEEISQVFAVFYNMPKEVVKRIQEAIQSRFGT